MNLYSFCFIFLLLFIPIVVKALNCDDVDSNGNVYVANTVTSIDEKAFKECDALTSVTF